MIRSKFSAVVVMMMALGGAGIGADAASGDLRRVADPVEGEYVVVFRDAVRDVRGLARGLALEHGASLGHVYRHALKGFSVRTSEARAIALSRNPNVAYVEEAARATTVATQSPATWGIDRIDQRDLPRDNAYTYDATGAGVRAYVIDTGIRFSHAEFGGRAASGIDTISGDANASDCNGHGTHVAGTIGGAAYGVAKQVSLVGVRVLDCQGSGSSTSVIAGVDWVTANHVKPAVANMSLGFGGAVSSVDTAVANSIAAGVTYAIAAGNGDAFGRAVDACKVSPARVTSALTVSATNSSDAKPSWANVGTCLDLFAPGVSITSAWHRSDTDTNTISGTSMAAPHVAGVAALLLQGAPASTPATVASVVTTNATPDRISGAGTGSPNLLLYSAFIGGGTPQNAAPTAVFTASCSGLQCSFDAAGSSDSDGSIASYAWAFGDGSTASGATASHTYAAGGTYTVTLTVTDDDGATDAEAKALTVSSGAITLSARGYKQKGLQKVELTWSGASGASVDVYRNGVKVATTANDGSYVDPINKKGGGSYQHRVCNAGTTTCSNTTTTSF